MDLDLDRVNRELGAQPQELIEWACGLGGRAIATSNFGPFSAVLLHMLTRTEPDVPVVWIDSGYNTPATYHYAEQLTDLLKLDLHIYVPSQTRARREALHDGVPLPDDPRHADFTREVKLEPFGRALRELAPKVWFTAIRSEQTAHRASLQPVTVSPGEMLKVAPVFHWSTKQMHEYLKRHRLPNNFDYYDPTKVEEKRECGLHLAR